MEFYMVLTTVSEVEKAEKIGEKVVKERLAACANAIPRIKSIYRWKGEVKNEEESLLLVKTTDEKLNELKARIEELHSYETPEVLAMPIESRTEDYLEWMRKNVG